MTEAHIKAFHAAAMRAGAAHAARAGREAWDESDRKAALAEYDRLVLAQRQAELRG
jgi:hypothetical protein